MSEVPEKVLTQVAEVHFFRQALGDERGGSVGENNLPP
jgi:hypothetical protein